MDSVLAFIAALLSLHLSGRLLGRWRARCAPELLAWAGALLAFAVGSAALAWGAAAGWDDRVFRIYYLFGGLLSAPLLGAGSLLLAGRKRARAAALLYVGLAVGVAVAVPITGHIHGSGIPAAQHHLDFVPARLLAVLGNSLGTLAVVLVALLTIRRRPLGNALILAGVAIAAVGSGLAGLGAAETSVFVAIAAIFLYAGFVAPFRFRSARALLARQQTSPN